MNLDFEPEVRMRPVDQLELNSRSSNSDPEVVDAVDC